MVAKQLLPPSPQKDHIHVKISHQKIGKNKTIKKCSICLDCCGAGGGQGSGTKGALRSCYLDWQTSRHPAHTTNSRFSSDCCHSPLSIRHQKSHHPSVGHLIVVCAQKALVSSTPQPSRVTFCHRTTSVICADRWQVSVLAPFITRLFPTHWSEEANVDVWHMRSG